jgi:hypothetical protein
LIGCALVAFRKIEQVPAVAGVADALGVFGELSCAAAVFAGAAAAFKLNSGSVIETQLPCLFR